MPSFPVRKEERNAAAPQEEPAARIEKHICHPFSSKEATSLRARFSHCHRQKNRILCRLMEISLSPALLVRREQTLTHERQIRLRKLLHGKEILNASPGRREVREQPFDNAKKRSPNTRGIGHETFPSPSFFTTDRTSDSPPCDIHKKTAKVKAYSEKNRHGQALHREGTLRRKAAASERNIRPSNAKKGRSKERPPVSFTLAADDFLFQTLPQARRL